MSNFTYYRAVAKKGIIQVIWLLPPDGIEHHKTVSALVLAGWKVTLDLI